MYSRAARPTSRAWACKASTPPAGARVGRARSRTLTVLKAASCPRAFKLQALSEYHEQSSFCAENVTYEQRAHAMHRPTQSANDRTRCSRVFHEPLSPFWQSPSTPSLVTPQKPRRDTLSGQLWT